MTTSNSNSKQQNYSMSELFEQCFEIMKKYAYSEYKIGTKECLSLNLNYRKRVLTTEDDRVYKFIPVAKLDLKMKKVMLVNHDMFQFIDKEMNLIMKKFKLLRQYNFNNVEPLNILNNMFIFCFKLTSVVSNIYNGQMFLSAKLDPDTWVWILVTKSLNQNAIDYECQIEEKKFECSANERNTWYKKMKI